ncbi:MAG: hypothetical protein IT186_01410 [Acidobacteria bacterium]|nr:hypothetical protein [Acidobacteriota bacterium]MCG3191161.1 hypothetical protein [Thermoanaerobaculia bacterium]MCK6681648.1 hypothetical protein [Thermoanaerobaculia bacterium]
MTVQKLFRSFRTSLSLSSLRGYKLEDEVALYRLRAEIAIREERYQDALVFLAKILRLNPYDLGCRMDVAEIYHHALGESEKAVLAYRQILATAGYDETNPFCSVAAEAISDLTGAANASEHLVEELPLQPVRVQAVV